MPEVSFLNDMSLVHSGQKIFVHFVMAQLQKSTPWKVDTGSEILFFSSVRAHIQLDSETASLMAATANGSEMYCSQKAQLSL